MTVIDDKGDWLERWECEAPPLGSSYIVVDESWDHSGDKPVRTIRRIDPVPPAPKLSIVPDTSA